MDKYLPKEASIDEASEWLEEMTGEPWPLPRMQEHGLMPWFWLDYSPDAPKELFGDRTEGFAAPICFSGDTKRLEFVGGNAIVTMIRSHDGTHFRFNPGLEVVREEIRFLKKDLEYLAETFQKKRSETPSVSKATDVPKTWGVTKQKILSADWRLPKEAPADLVRVLEDVPKWVEEACNKSGRQGKGSHLWNPAMFAVCLATKTSNKQWTCNKASLDNIIKKEFSEYLEEWEEKSEFL